MRLAAVYGLRDAVFPQSCCRRLVGKWTYYQCTYSYFSEHLHNHFASLYDGCTEFQLCTECNFAAILLFFNRLFKLCL